MADTHRVILTSEARAELDGIASYIRQHSPQNAESVAAAIIESIDSLGFLPERFKVVGRSRKRGRQIHAMVVWPFIVYYRVDTVPNAVYVLKIVHGARIQPRRFE